MMGNRLVNFLIALLVVVVVLVGLCWLIWQGVLLIPVVYVRLWAILTTVAIPFVAWAGWWFGNVEARGKLAGFDKAIDKTFAGLSKAAGLRVNTTRAMRHVVQEPPVVVLPDVEIVQRRLPSGHDVIEL